MDQTAELLRELTEAHGVSGHEDEVAAIVRRHMEPHGAIETDRIGSVICRQGTSGPRVMLAAHMDEIGFMAHHITKEGYLKFLPLGGWWDQVLMGQRVAVRARGGCVTGVIGAKPSHLLPPEERSKLVQLKDMYIDVGACSREEVEALGLRPGDPVVPVSPFEVLAGDAYLGKAFDDRVGVALMVDLLRHFEGNGHPNSLCYAATAMEEVGCRGAKTCAAVIEPDVAIILEIDLCGDVPAVTPEESDVRLGGGPSLWLLDATMIPSPRLRNLVIDTAEELEIPLQFSAYTRAGTDGKHTHVHGHGVPSIVIGVPTRHVHSHAGILKRSDYDRTLRLLIGLLERLDEATVARL